MKLEFTTIAGRRMCRLTLTDTTRTAPPAETLVVLHEAIRQERDHHQQLQRDERAAQDAVRANVSHGSSAVEARGAVARIQDDITASAERVADLEALVEEVRADAAEGYAETLRQQCEVAMTATIATFPPIPTLEIFK